MTITSTHALTAADVDPDYLDQLLTEWTGSRQPERAALDLLRHGCDGFWLRHREFLRMCVDVVADGWTTVGPAGITGLHAEIRPCAAVHWERVGHFLADGVPVSAEHRNMLAAAASLVGVRTGSLREITIGLDEHHLALIAAALLDAARTCQP